MGVNKIRNPNIVMPEADPPLAENPKQI